MEKVKYISKKIPNSLVEVGNIPVPPEAKTQKDVAIYLIDLWDWAQSCKNKMNLIKKYNKEINNTKELDN